MTKRLSYALTAIVFGGIVFPSLGLGFWLQWKFSLPNWFWMIWGLLSLVVATEIQHRFGPAGAFQSVFIPSSFSTKDKVVYWSSLFATMASIIVFANFADEVSPVMRIVVLITIVVFLSYLPVRLFGSQELRLYFRKKK